MSDNLRSALHDLADQRADGIEFRPPPANDRLWQAGVARRRRDRALTGLAATALVATLVGLLTIWSATPGQLIPAGQPAATGQMYPEYVAKPLRIRGIDDDPGPRVAAISRGAEDTVYLVAQDGSVASYTPSPGPGAPSLSPDGQWLARGFDVVDLMTGAPLDYDGRGGITVERTLAEWPGLWTSSSERVFIYSFNQGNAESMGYVVDVETGATTAVPVIESGLDVRGGMAGWLDDRTLAAFGLSGPDELIGWTWRLGDSEWSPTGVRYRFDGTVDDPAISSVALSPDRATLLLTVAGVPSSATQTVSLDATTGQPIETLVSGPLRTAQIRQCRPAWSDGQPVFFHDRAARVVTEGEPLIEVSRWFRAECLALAGNELRGEPFDSTAARAWEGVQRYGGPVLMLLAVALAFLLRRVLRQRP